jgi:hydrogenase expression/formation protein HypD
LDGSGLDVRPELEELDAAKVFDLPEIIDYDPPGCLCAKVIQGKVDPPECPLFGRRCTPDNPVGPCMVSSEGTCAAHFKYGDGVA